MATFSGLMITVRGERAGEGPAYRGRLSRSHLRASLHQSLVTHRAVFTGSKFITPRVPARPARARARARSFSRTPFLSRQECVVRSTAICHAPSPSSISPFPRDRSHGNRAFVVRHRWTGHDDSRRVASHAGFDGTTEDVLRMRRRAPFRFYRRKLDCGRAATGRQASRQAGKTRPWGDTSSSC